MDVVKEWADIVKCRPVDLGPSFARRLKKLERVFCNPPWSNIPPFIELSATAELAVLLVPARTNVRWFHRALELKAMPRFFPKRPKFGNAPDGNKGHNSPVDCLLLVFGIGANSYRGEK